MSHDPEPLSGPPRNPGGLPPPGPPDPLAAALARLEPAAPALNRDRMMFTAGAASRTTVIRLWQFAAGFMTFVGFFAGMNYADRSVVQADHPAPAAPGVAHDPTPAVPPPLPAPPQGEPTPAPPPDPADASPTTPGDTYFYFTAPPGSPAAWIQMRNDVLTGGLGVLPDPGRSPGPAGRPPN
jgi:hypothetical protein